MTGSGPTTGDIPIVGTKLHPPGWASNRRERPRVSARLDSALEDRTRLTVLSAPPGYGKTYAVAGWLESRAMPEPHWV